VRDSLDFQLERLFQSNAQLGGEIAHLLNNFPKQVQAVASGTGAWVLSNSVFQQPVTITSTVTTISHGDSTAKPYAALLQLDVSYDRPISLQDFPERPPDDLVTAIVDREAALHRMPSVEWYKQERDALLPLPQAKSGHAGQESQDEDMRVYLHRVHDWRKHIASTAVQRYTGERLARRTFFLSFKVANVGHAPAKKVKIRCIFPKEISVNDSAVRIYGYRDAFDPPEGVQISVATIPNIMFPEWSEDISTQTQGPKPKYELEFGMAEFGFDGQNSYLVKIERLEHGDSRLIRPVRLNFREKAPIFSFELSYNLHATNVPQDVEGRESVAVHCETFDVYGNPRTESA
jgi:hypothetical protein